MNNNTTLFNQPYNIEAALYVDEFNDIGPSKTIQALPLKYPNHFRGVTIIDNITNPCLSGSATIANETSNIDELIDFSSQYANYFRFNINQIIESHTINSGGVFSINSITNVPQNELISNLHITFESAFFGSLKNISPRVNDIPKYTSGRVSDMLHNIFTDFSKDGKDNISIIDWYDTTTNTQFIVPQYSNMREIFDIIYRNSFSTNASDADSIFHILDYTKQNMLDKQAYYTLTPINKPFLDLFFSLQTTGVSNLNNIVLEGVREGGSDIRDSITAIMPSFSDALEVQISEPDPEIVRKKYRNIRINTTSSNGTTNQHYINFYKIIENFKRIFTNDSGLISLDIKPNFTFSDSYYTVESKYPDLEPGLTYAKIYNMLLFNSKMIRFKLKGQTYRKPGMFIYFHPKRRGDGTDKRYYKLAGFWYIIEVKHIFEDNKYYNEMICVNPFNYSLFLSLIKNIK